MEATRLRRPAPPVDATAEARIPRALHAAFPLVGPVALRPRLDGWTASIALDPSIVRARAEQQGLAVASVAAAVASPRVQQAIADVVSRVNATAHERDRIVEYEVVAELPTPSG